jgi:glycosyltransferase involved in cell wall biosynthesis
MKILVVHEVSYERKVVYEIHEFPELLNLRGHDVTFFEFDEGARISDLSAARCRTIPGRIHNRASIRIVTPQRLGIPALDRYLAIFSSVPALWKLLRNGEFDVVLNYAVPTFGIQVMILGRIFGVPVLHRALDVSNKIRKSIWNPLIAVYEKICFHLATLVSANNSAMVKYVNETLGPGHKQKVILHYPPLDKGIFKPTVKDKALAETLGITARDRVLVYMGSFFYFSGLDKILRELAKDRMQNLKLLLIGGGEQETLLRKLVSDYKLTHQVVFTGFVEFHDLPRYMALGHVALSPLEISPVASAAFPHKVLQYMAVGLPTVSTKLDGLYGAFGDFSGIRWVDSPVETLDAALEILELDAAGRENQIRLQIDVLEKLFSPEVTVVKLESTLAELIQSRRRNA